MQTTYLLTKACVWYEIGVTFSQLNKRNLSAFILIAENGKATVFGIVSAGIGGCGIDDAPGGIYANVYSMIDFIEDVMVSFKYI